jgi:hypothetical protein
MGRLIIETETLVGSYAGPSTADSFAVVMSVTDADGVPRAGLTEQTVTLTWIDGGSIGALSSLSSGGSEFGNAGYYEFLVVAGGPGSVFLNGTQLYGLAVADGGDQGQTLFEATVEGRPPPPER